jgi:hypothetical protein
MTLEYFVKYTGFQSKIFSREVDWIRVVLNNVCWLQLFED